MAKKKSKIISKSTVKLKGKDGGNFTEKKISKLRGRLLMKRYKRKQN